MTLVVSKVANAAMNLLSREAMNKPVRDDRWSITYGRPNVRQFETDHSSCAGV